MFAIQGRAEPPFERLRDAFAWSFEEGEETGAAVAVFIEGVCVVDLYGGYADRTAKTPWTEETIAAVYSSGKMAIALLMARAVSEGALDYEAPVSAYWPDFAAAGKGAITVGEALSHQAGLCGFIEPMAPEEWLRREAILARLASMAPLWPPGSASGYHPQTIGFIADEILRRATARGIAAQLREDFPGLALYCGLRPDEMARAALMAKPPRAPDLGAITPLKTAAFLAPWSAPGKMAREAWMAAALPASNMHGAARALAEIASPFADRGRFRRRTILSPAALEAARAERISGPDLVLPFDLSWAAGLMRNESGHFGPSREALGHAGFGGSCVFADPAHRLSFAYVTAKMSPHLVADPRALRLIAAAYDAL